MGRRLGKFGVLVFGLVVGLVACELALRGVFYVGLLPESNPWVRLVTSVEEGRANRMEAGSRLFRPSKIRALGWEPVPGASRGHIRINSSGFRGPEVPLQAAQEVERIVVLGDSETFGMELEEKKAFPGALEQALGEAFPARDFEVLNFGVPGYSTAQELAVLKSRALEFEPDAVVLYYVFNDPEIDHRALIASGRIRYHSHLVLLWEAIRLSGSGLTHLRETARNPVEYYHLLHSSEYFEATRQMLRDMETLLASREIPFILVVSPALSGYSSLQQYPYGAIHEKLGNLASPTLHVFDPTPALVARFHHPRELWVLPDDPHKNELANRVIATELARPLGGILGFAPELPEPLD